MKLVLRSPYFTWNLLQQKVDWSEISFGIKSAILISNLQSIFSFDSLDISHWKRKFLSKTQLIIIPFSNVSYFRLSMRANQNTFHIFRIILVTNDFNLNRQFFLCFSIRLSSMERNFKRILKSVLREMKRMPYALWDSKTYLLIRNSCIIIDGKASWAN